MAKKYKNDIDATITMESAITHLGMEHELPIVSGSEYYKCPFCGQPKKKKKFNINFENGTYNCFSCGNSGNAIRFWAYFRGYQYDLSRAGVDYIEFLKDKKRQGKPIKVPPPPEPKVKTIEIASIEARHLAYSALLNQLSLSDIHYENLINRGLDNEYIIKGGYKSAPGIATNALCHAILSKGIALEGVPGFYKHNGEWRFVNYGAGFLIPTRDIEGRIQGLQIRRDVISKDDARYLTISSAGKERGTAGHTYPHVNLGNGNLKEIILTEGPLKGNIISKFTGYPSISILGVNARSTLPELLKEFKSKGTRYINIAFDMDMYTNKNVRKALLQLKKLITSAGFRFCTLVWDKNEKGLDDFLYAKTQHKKETPE